MGKPVAPRCVCKLLAGPVAQRRWWGDLYGQDLGFYGANPKLADLDHRWCAAAVDTSHGGVCVDGSRAGARVNGGGVCRDADVRIE